MASNPRIDDLRRRLGKEPRLFAQLAEELRKEGELAEAIRVCREGLSRNPNYPSARITLGRALLDSGSTAAARTELETALKGAPDNILAGRLLAECLESLGDTEGALSRYRSTLLLAPGDRQIQARINELEKRPRTAARPVEARPLPTSGPIPVSQVQGPMELEIRDLLPPSAPPARPPAAEAPALSSPAAPGPEADAEVLVEPLVPMEDESFELESAYDSPSSHWAAHHSEPAAPPAVAPVFPAATLAPASVMPAPPPVAPAPPPPAPPAVAATPPSVLPPPIAVAPLPETAIPAPAPPPALSPAVPVSPAASPAAAPVPAAELSTPTLAEIYASQGLLDKAVAVYRQILERDSHDERARARLDELEKERAAAAARPPRLAPERRAAIQRTIGRMESWLAALHRAAP